MASRRARRAPALTLIAAPVPPKLAQLDGYLAGLGLDGGWLMIFDRRPGLAPVAERITTSVEKGPAGRAVTVIRA